MLQLPPPSPKAHPPDKPFSSGETELMVPIQSVTSAVAGEQNENKLDENAGEGVAASNMPAGDGTGMEPVNDRAAADGEESADDKKIRYAEMLKKAKAALELAEEIRAMAEEYSEAPVRLSNEFVSDTFPFDPRDNSYAFCIICGLPGDLLLCDNDGCPNVMHRHCGGLSEVPEADWFCGQCVSIRSNEDDMNEDKESAAMMVAERAPPNELKPEDDAEADKVDTDEEDAKGGTEGNGKKPAAVTSCLPPIVTFDDKEESKLASELDDLYFFRTGRRRGEKPDDKDEKLKLGKSGSFPPFFVLSWWSQMLTDAVFRFSLSLAPRNWYLISEEIWTPRILYWAGYGITHCRTTFFQSKI